jgi:hypothetical protein
MTKIEKFINGESGAATTLEIFAEFMVALIAGLFLLDKFAHLS